MNLKTALLFLSPLLLLLQALGSRRGGRRSETRRWHVLEEYQVARPQLLQCPRRIRLGEGGIERHGDSLRGDREEGDRRERRTAWRSVCHHLARSHAQPAQVAATAGRDKLEQCSVRGQSKALLSKARRGRWLRAEQLA